MRLRVTVPASAGNAGPGFDSFGLAYGLYNEVIVDTEKPGAFQAEGEGVHQLERARLDRRARRQPRKYQLVRQGAA